MFFIRSCAEKKKKRHIVVWLSGEFLPVSHFEHDAHVSLALAFGTSTQQTVIHQADVCVSFGCVEAKNQSAELISHVSSCLVIHPQRQW